MKTHTPSLSSTTTTIAATTLFLVLAIYSAQSIAATKIKIGRSTNATVFELPAYVAMEKGFFEQEGLDATFVPLTRKALVTAGIAGAIDFSPASRGGAQAALKGAALRFVAGQSSRSHWTVAVSPFVVRAGDLKGKVIAFGRAGTAGYEEGKIALSRTFKLEAGRDYTLRSIPRPSDRMAALQNGEAHGAVLSLGDAAKAAAAGFPDFIPSGQTATELNGAFWVRTAYLEKNRAAVAGFIRAITTAIRYISLNDEGSTDVIQKYLGIKKRGEATHYWRAVRDMYSPAIRTDLLTALFEERLNRMIRKGLWLKSKPAPEVEQFVARKLLTETLREMRHDVGSGTITTSAPQ